MVLEISPEALVDETVEEWKKEKNYLYRESDKELYVSTNYTLMNDQLNREVKNRVFPIKLSLYLTSLVQDLVLLMLVIPF